jgi:hypothetical protein
MSTTLHGVIGLSGAAFKAGGFSGITEQIVRLEMPDTFKGEGIRKSKKDLEMLLKMLSDHPEDSAELFDAVLQNRLPEATKIGDRLGLSEHKFIAKGGGLGWVVAVMVAVAVFVMAASAAEDNKTKKQQ